MPYIVRNRTMYGMRVEIRCTAEELEYWRAAAQADGHTLSSWLRRIANLAILTPGQRKELIDAYNAVSGQGQAIVREEGELAPLGRSAQKTHRKPLCPSCIRKGDGKNPLPACGECNR